MERTPEPELMDEAEQALAYADTDFSEVNQGLVERFCATFPDWRRGRLLDLGSGPGEVALRFARALPEVRVDALDGSQAMLALGRARVSPAPCGERVNFVRVYLPDLPFAPAVHDAIFSNSLLHHLADPRSLWEALAHCARPEAPLLVCDLFRPESEARAREIVAAEAAEEAPILQEDFFRSLLAAYSLEEVRAQIQASGLRLEVEAISDRHLMAWGRR